MDSAPVRGDGYEPGLRSSDPEPTQRRRTACGQDLVVVMSVVGGSEKFSDGEILKITTIGPLQFSHYYSPTQGTCTIEHGCTAFDSIPRPPTESINNLTLTNKRAQMSEQTSKYTAPPNPQGESPAEHAVTRH